LVPSEADQGGIAGGPAQIADSAVGGQPPGAKAFSNRFLATILIGIMALMAILGLGVALTTTQSRRAHDNQQAIGFLPPDTNLIAFVDVAQALHEPIGREVLTRLHLGNLALDAARLESWTGLKLDEMDKLFLGMRLDDRLIPRVTLVVKTLKAYDEARVRSALKNPKEITRNKRRLVRFSVGQGPLSGAVWFPADTILVAALSPEDLDEVPPTPYPGLHHLPPPLQGVINQKLDNEAAIWIIGNSDDYEKTAAWALLSRLTGRSLDPFIGLQTWAISIRLGEALGLTANCRFATAEQAQTARRYVSDRLGQKKPPAKAAEDNWINVKFQTTVAALEDALNQFAGQMRDKRAAP
jgi:hypothetical protein